MADAIDACKAVKTTIETADDRNRYLTRGRDNFGERKLFHFMADIVDQCPHVTPETDFFREKGVARHAILYGLVGKAGPI